MPAIHIWTDGSCIALRPGTRCGGWAALIQYAPSADRLISGGLADGVDAPRAELWACIHALEHLARLRRTCEVVMHSDSKFVVGRMTGARIVDSNVDLFDRLISAAACHEVAWELCPGHSGVFENEVVNQRANAEARKMCKQIRERKGGRGRWAIKGNLISTAVQFAAVSSQPLTVMRELPRWRYRAVQRRIARAQCIHRSIR